MALRLSHNTIVSDGTIDTYTAYSGTSILINQDIVWQFYECDSYAPPETEIYMNNACYSSILYTYNVI